MSKFGTRLRKWSRNLHRDLSYFLSGMVFIYAISGIVMNHRKSINPNYSVDRTQFELSSPLPVKDSIQKADVLAILAPLNEEKNYTQHYFPNPTTLKVFLKGGSNLVVDLSTQTADYEKLTPRYVISALTRLHYNPGKWWTYFADFFAVGLIILTITGLIMIKGKKGILGWGGLELLLGMLVPILFLVL